MRFLFAVVCLLLFSEPFQAQTAIQKTRDAIHSKKIYTVEDGLTQGYITQIFEDSQGFLWVGTLNGLNRFDGKTFETFTENPSDSFSVKGQFVDQILEDHLNRIWVVYNNGTVSVFDAKKQRFHSVELSGYLPHPERNYFKLLCHKGEFWIEQKEKIGRVTLTHSNAQHATWQAEVKYLPVLDEHNKIPFRLLNVQFDDQDRLWISSVTQVLTIDKPYANADTLRAKNYPIPESPDSLHHFVLLKLSNDSLWLGTWLGDVFLLKDEKRLHHSRYKPVGKHPGFNTLVTDANGIKWLRNGSVAVLYDMESRTFYETDLSCTFLCQTKEGAIWTGTEGFGLHKTTPANSPFLNIGNAGYGIAPGQEMYAGALAQGRKGEVMMVNRGIWRLDKETGEWKENAAWLQAIKEYEEITNYFGYVEDAKGRNWIATNAGLYCQEADGSVTVYRGNMRLNDSLDLYFDAVMDVFEDEEENVWAINSGYLHQFDEERQRFLRYTYLEEYRPAREDHLNSFLDIDDALWLATESGLYIFNRVDQSFTGKKININGADLENVSYSALHQDQSNAQHIWIGTKNKGLYRYDVEQGTWQHVGKENGLTNNTIYAIAQDQLNRIWVSTNAGLFLYLPEENGWMNFRKQNGIQGNEFNSRSFLQQEDGTLLFGGMNGVTLFNPHAVQKQEQNRPIVLKEVVFEQQVGDTTQLSAVEDLTVPIALAFKDSRRLELEFAWLNYNQPENHSYAYRLSENGRWIDLGTQNQVSFYNLNAGDYTFQVKATDWLGNTNSSILSVPLTILAPWYKTTWAYLAYGLLALALLVAVFRVRENRKRLKVEAAFSRNEAERYKDLEQTKTRFFSSITHEFKTPLTLVIGPLEQLYKSAKASADKTLISTAKKNAADLLYLINQLLDLNKMEQGKMPVKYSKGDMALFVSEICAKSKAMADAKNIALQFETKPDVLETSFDSRKLERIVINLLSNALKFSPEKTTVVVGLTQRGDDIELYVQDEGPGIPPEKMETVFDQFYQLDGSEKRKHGGTGIGLALVKEYAELLGATISVQNNPTKGCTFQVVLPRVEAEIAVELDAEIDTSGLGAPQRLLVNPK
jgi:signal transduction histidine kinase/ligand-binding sensor domain-containing protein